MLDQSLLQSHFIGRDGFRWWIGQIPPIDSWSDQVDGDGWGLRYKVRILGYHSLNPSDLPNEDLPWAQVMLPTTAGSGASNFAQPPRIRQSDMVIGFFMDGDNAQIPIIMGILGRTSDWSTDGYSNPFTPFTGYTTIITNDGSRLERSESNEHGSTSQPSPVILEKPTAEGQGKIPASTAIGSIILFADTCEDTTFKNIKNELQNLMKFVQNAEGGINEYRQRINAAVDVITSSINWVVGKMFDYIYNLLVGTDENPGLIPNGLNTLYSSIFGTTLASTGNAGEAHQRGSDAISTFIPAIETLEEAIACVSANIIRLMKSIISQLVNSFIENVENLVDCAVEQFLGTLVNSIIQAVSDGLSSALSGVSSILGAAFNIVELLQETVNTIKSIGGLFDCNQENTKCSGVKEWTIGYGPRNTSDVDSAFDNIIENVNNISSTAQELASNVDSAFRAIDSVNTAIDVFDPESSFNNAVNSASSCFYGVPTNCGSPVINIFGGGGSGATAIPIFGEVREVQQTQEAINNVRNTASVIGATITNRGSGYRYPPSVEITDPCNLGYGAVARAVINDQGEVEAIYLVSPGEGYPSEDQETPGVIDIYVESPGSGYSDGDTAIDNLGNVYNLTVNNGTIISVRPLNIQETNDLPVIRIVSSTGSGAILRPILGSIANISINEINTQIDCPI
jgi:hypothetical protein